MTTEIDVEEVDRSTISFVRTALGFAGLAALVFGVLILAWPEHTAMFIVALFVIAWAAIAGVVNLAIGIFSKNVKVGSRVGSIILGILFLALAIIAWANLAAFTAAFGFLLGIVVGVVWIIEGIVTLASGFGSKVELWPTLYALLSIIAGIVVLTAPLWAVGLLWLILGIALVVVGIVQIIRGFSFGR